MAEPKGSTAPQAKPKRRLRNYLLDRKFQFKYALLLSGASGLLMAVMGALLYVRMQDAEQRLLDESRFAHAGIAAEADAAALMVRREMEISAQQLINRQMPCVAPPACANAPSLGNSPGVDTQSSGTACDAETCKPLCEALGIQPAASAPAPAEPAAPPAPAEPAAAAPVAAPEAAREGDRAPEPVTGQSEDEQQRQRELIRKIEETVKGETDQRAHEMESETRARLATLDADTQKRMGDLRDANHRDLRAILVSLVLIFVILVAVGIVVTHKVVGPIYRMKMLIGKIHGDNLVLEGKLRKGDELQDLFEEVQGMLDRLRAHQQGEVGSLGELLGRLRGAATDGDREKVLADLEKFRGHMASVLDKK